VRALWLFECSRFFTKKGTINQRSGDLTNLIQGPEDALTKAGIIADDSLITEIQAYKKHGDKDRIILVLIPDSSVNSAINQRAKNSRKQNINPGG
jgi:hypothetical protein